MAHTLTVRFATIETQDQARTFRGDFGFTPSPGMVIDVGGGATSRLTVRRVLGHIGGDMDVTADCRIFEDVPAARAFATALTNRLQSLGFTVQP